MVDEAQSTYWDDQFWSEFIKEVVQGSWAGKKHYVGLFSYGSDSLPDAVTPPYLGPEKTVSLRSDPNYPYAVALLLNPEEFIDALECKAKGPRLNLPLKYTVRRESEKEREVVEKEREGVRKEREEVRKEREEARKEREEIREVRVKEWEEVREEVREEREKVRVERMQLREEREREQLRGQPRGASGDRAGGGRAGAGHHGSRAGVFSL